VEKSAANVGTITLDQVKKVAQTIKTLGGYQRVTELLEIIKETGGMKKFKDLAEAISATASDAIPF
jgi:DNA/RNA endonuclease YhcR with UshA esterase domain